MHFAGPKLPRDSLFALFFPRDSSKPVLRTMKCPHVTVSAQDKQMICVGLLGGHLLPKKK